MTHYENDVAPYIPTPDEIAAACLEIQATWTPAEEDRHRVMGKYVPFAIRVQSTGRSGRRQKQEEPGT